MASYFARVVSAAASHYNISAIHDQEQE
jgi:hypothetical protein